MSGDDDAPRTMASAFRPNRAGFPITFVGLFLFVLGIAALLWAQGLTGEAKYAWRRVAGMAVGLASILFILGLQVALPSRRWARWMAGFGCVFSGAGLAVFAWAYPHHWNVPTVDYSTHGLVPFAAGIVLIGTAAFTGALDAYLDLRAGRPLGTRAIAANEHVSEEEVLRDLEEAARKSKLTWGGVYDQDTPSLVLKDVAQPVSILRGNIGRRHVLENAATGDEVTRLRAFRGGAVTASEAEDESPAQALAALRRERTSAAQASPKLVSRLARNVRTWFSPHGEDAPEAPPGGLAPPSGAESGGAAGREEVAFEVLDGPVASAFNPLDDSSVDEAADWPPWESDDPVASRAVEQSARKDSEGKKGRNRRP